jgi:hypothetical protein
MSVLVHMRYLADAAFNDAHWATLTGPIAAALPQDSPLASPASPRPRRRLAHRCPRRADRGRAGRGGRATGVERAHRHRPGRRVSCTTADRTSSPSPPSPRSRATPSTAGTLATSPRRPPTVRPAYRTRHPLNPQPNHATETAMTTAITEHDQDTGATSTRYHYTRVVEIVGKTVRARVERGVYLNDSGAVAEVLTAQAEWISLAADALNNWWHDTPPPSPDIPAATVLGPLAERPAAPGRRDPRRTADHGDLVASRLPGGERVVGHQQRLQRRMPHRSGRHRLGDQPRRSAAHLRAPRQQRHLHQSPPRRMPFRGKQRRSGLRRRMLLRPSAPVIGPAHAPTGDHP